VLVWNAAARSRIGAAAGGYREATSNEITFNSPLMGELRAIEFIARLIDQGRCRAA
jgi:hypothetical protein